MGLFVYCLLGSYFKGDMEGVNKYNTFSASGNNDLVKIMENSVINYSVVTANH